MALEITKTVITPTLWLAVEFAPAVVQPLSYELTADNGVDAPVTVTASKLKGRIGPLVHRETYQVTVTAVYADPLDNVTGDPATVTMLPIAGFADVIRQAIWDILYANPITVDGRNVLVTHDGMFCPVSLSERGPTGIQWPAIEVRVPISTSSEMQSLTRGRETFDVPIRLLDAGLIKNDHEPMVLGRLYGLVQDAINNTRNLGISALGVVDKSWTWQRATELERHTEKAKVLRAILTVPINVALGQQIFP